MPGRGAPVAGPAPDPPQDAGRDASPESTGVAELGPEFFDRDTPIVARDLLGRELRLDAGDRAVRAVIVEVEAYLGAEDPASHAHRGPTPRAGIMFGPPGRLYVYLSYGMHHCANLVTGPAGVAGAVLLRAARVLAGEEVVRERRPGPLPGAALLRGPGNLCRGLGISLADNGQAVGEGRLALLGGRPASDEQVARGPRVGITRAAELPLRLWLRDEAAVSGSRGRRAGAGEGGGG